MKTEVSEDELLTILAIGHITSERGQGLSLRDAMGKARYRELRPRFDASHLLPFIQLLPEFIDQWLAHSEDKRTDGGWYLEENGWMGTIAGDRYRCRSRPKADAEYVIRELDFWASLRDGNAADQ